MGAAGAVKVRRGDVRHAIVVRTAKKVQRKDGMVVRFDDNACALIGKNGEPMGTRINGETTIYGWKLGLMLERRLTLKIGVVGSELRDKQWSKILSLASMHI